MDTDHLFLSIAWFVIAYPCVIHAVDRFDEVTPLQRIGLISASVFWPITAVLALPIVVSSMVTSSVSDIRIRLRNRGVMKEFEEFMAARDPQICQKDSDEGDDA